MVKKEGKCPPAPPMFAPSAAPAAPPAPCLPAQAVHQARRSQDRREPRDRMTISVNYSTSWCPLAGRDHVGSEHIACIVLLS